METTKKKRFGDEEYLFGGGLFLILLMGGALGLFWKKLPPQIPWFYSLPWGEGQLILKEHMIWVLVGLIGLYSFSYLISGWVGKNDAITKKTLLIGALLAVVLFLASFTRVFMIFLI